MKRGVMAVEVLSVEQYGEANRLIKELTPTSSIFFGTVCASDRENKTMKVILQPSGVETVWCRVVEGAFCEEEGVDVLVAVVKGKNSGQYVVIGILE